MTEHYLFSSGRLSDYLQALTDNIKTKIYYLSEKEIQDPAFEHKISQMNARNTLIVPVLNEAEIGFKESKVEVTGDSYRSLGRPSIVNATKLTVFIPFHGTPDLFNFSPSTFSHSYPLANVKSQELVLEFIVRSHETIDKVRQDTHIIISDIKWWLGNVFTDVEIFNHALPGIINTAVAYRKEQLAKTKKLGDDLGFKRRD